MMVKTLWVDDKIKELYSAYKLEADDYGIELIPFDCWEKAKVELVNHYDDYSAIILDVGGRRRLERGRESESQGRDGVQGRKGHLRWERSWRLNNESPPRSIKTAGYNGK